IPVAVVLARVVVPLFIPIYPLPAILAALVIDGLDQTIFSATLDRDLPGYQSYDKALDIYYLTVTYLSTMRNWDRGPAFGVGRFLWYYRLIGVTLFEYTGLRWLLFVFANTFEYFVIALEGWKVWRNPFRLSRRTIITVAAAIWIFIKLPQEWWIHIAQLDFTDFMKETIFGVPADSSWTDAIANSPLVALTIVLAILGLAALAWWGRRFLPPRDWDPTFSAETQAEHLGWPRGPRRVVPAAQFDRRFFEKVALLSIMVFVFSRMLPGTEGNVVQVAIGVATIIAASTVVSHLLASRGVHWTSVAAEFATMFLINAAIGIAIGILLPGEARSGPPLPEFLFLVGVLSLIVVLYDRATEIRRLRRPNQRNVR
ncbi:MAG TPA: hypothetical protein VFW95_11595, partial [Candidatus Limnocylindria bacterium]|nr:hypothetical protein [Candidatus Limnocylindria bacterium]